VGEVGGELQKDAVGIDSESRNGTACGFVADISLFALQNDHIFCSHV
jgi:hypothetical protein